jgi:hypothetical protein
MKVECVIKGPAHRSLEQIVISLPHTSQASIENQQGMRTSGLHARWRCGRRDSNAQRQIAAAPAYLGRLSFSTSAAGKAQGARWPGRSGTIEKLCVRDITHHERGGVFFIVVSIRLLRNCTSMTYEEQIDLLRSEVERIVAESGTGTPFNASVWLENWLIRPAPALGGRIPAELLAEPGGFDLVIGLLRQMQSGAYA